MMEQKMKEEQERRKKKEMEERMSLEETKEQVSNSSLLPVLVSSSLPFPHCYLLILLPDSETTGETFSSTGGEAPAFLAAQKSFA